MTTARPVPMTPPPVSGSAPSPRGLEGLGPRSSEFDAVLDRAAAEAGRSRRPGLREERHTGSTRSDRPGPLDDPAGFDRADAPGRTTDDRSTAAVGQRGDRAEPGSSGDDATTDGNGTGAAGAEADTASPGTTAASGTDLPLVDLAGDPTRPDPTTPATMALLSPSTEPTVPALQPGGGNEEGMPSPGAETAADDAIDNTGHEADADVSGVDDETTGADSGADGAAAVVATMAPVARDHRVTAASGSPAGLDDAGTVEPGEGDDGADEVPVHDAATAGGRPLERADGLTVADGDEATAVPIPADDRSASPATVAAADGDEPVAAARVGEARPVGETTATPRAEQPAATDAAPPLSPNQGDTRPGPDPVWRQVHRALGAMRTTSDGQREITLHLHPAELGSVTVRISTGGAGTTIAMVTQSGAAANQLNQQRQELLDELASTSLGGATVDIGTRGGSGDPGDEPRRNRSGNGAGTVAGGLDPGHPLVVEAGPIRRRSNNIVDLTL